MDWIGMNKEVESLGNPQIPTSLSFGSVSLPPMPFLAS